MADPTHPWTRPAFAIARPALSQWLPALALVARRVWPLAVVAAVASWLGFFIITPLPFIELEAFRATIIFHLVAGLVFAGYLVSLVAGRRLPGGSALDGPLTALLAVYLLTAAASLSWRVSLEVALLAIMAAGVFYVLSDGRLFRAWQVETAFLLAALAAALKALWIVGGDYLDWLRLTSAVQDGLSLGNLIPPTVPKVHDVGDHPNLLGAILAMSLPFFLVAIFRPVHAGLRVLAALGAATVAMAIFLSLARSAWIGAFLGTGTAAILLLVATPAGRDLPRRLWPSSALRRGALLAGALAIVLAGGLAAAYATRSVEARPLWLFRESATPRLDTLEAGAEMVRDYPWLGTGPAMYSLLYPEYSGRFPNHAFHSHNGFLQAAIDMGVPGVVAMVGLAATLGWLLVQGLRRTKNEARLGIVASAGAFVAFATFSLFDAPNEFKGPLVALAAAGAIAVLSLREGADERAPRSFWLDTVVPALPRLAAPVLIAGLLITWGRLDLGHYFYSNGVSNANAGRWEEAIEGAKEAVELDPEFAIYRLQLGTVEAQAYLATGSPPLLQDAIADLEAGLEMEPRSAIGYANVAMLLAEAGDRRGAREAALQALEFDNNDPAIALAAGTALETANWGNAAAQAYARALLLDANLVDSPFWNGTPFRRARFDDIISASALIFNPCLMLRLASEDLPSGPLSRDDALVACRERVAADPENTDGRVALANALLDDGETDEAFALLNNVLTRQPDHAQARMVLGSLHAAQGKTDQARAEWLRAGQLGETRALVLLGDSYPPGGVPPEVASRLNSELRDTSSQVQFHLIGILYYRFKFFRGSPITILLPGDWQEAVPARYTEAQDALSRWAGAAGGP